MKKTEIVKEINKTQDLFHKFDIWITTDAWANKIGICIADFHKVLSGKGSDNATKKAAEFFEIEVLTKKL